MSGRDIGASVRQRLLNQSRAQGRPFQELLQYFAMERFSISARRISLRRPVRFERCPIADRLAGAVIPADHGH